jgi:hypothetical protein
MGLSLGGCLAENAEELERLMKEDAAFKTMIVSRDEVRAQIQLVKQDLLTRKNALDTQVQGLRAAYDAHAKAQNKKIEQLRLAIDANKNQLKLQTELALTALEQKTTELAGYRKTLADVKKVLSESKGITLSKAERQKWEERILMLSEKIRPLAEEVQELKLQIRLKKQKIGYLR